MSFSRRALSWGCAATLLVTALSSPAMAAGVSCVVPDLWKAEPKIEFRRLAYDQSIFDFAEFRLDPAIAREVELHNLQIMSQGYPAPKVYAAAESYSSPRTWRAVYRGTGYDRLQGEARARVAAGGVLWLLKPSDLGVGQSEAIAALRDSGATVARVSGGGMVEIRARRESVNEIVAAAAAQLGGSSEGEIELGQRRLSYGATQSASDGRLEIAMLRVEGRSAQSPAAFIDGLPTPSMEVFVFGTSYVIKVPASDMEHLQNYMEDQGQSVVLVGASAQPMVGKGIGEGIRACGANVLADRFPMPVVAQINGSGVAIQVERQYVNVAQGEALLVVQAPAWGTGLEVGLIRIGK